MARAGRGVTVTRAASRPRPATTLFAGGDRLDIDALHCLVEDAEVITEGDVYGAPASIGREPPGRRFLGSTLLTLDLQAAMLTDRTNEALARRLRDALISDPRARQVIRDRAFRETARLLGAQMPANLEVDYTVSCQDLRILIDVDVEAPIGVAAAPGG